MKSYITPVFREKISSALEGEKAFSRAHGNNHRISISNQGIRINGQNIPRDFFMNSDMPSRFPKFGLTIATVFSLKLPKRREERNDFYRNIAQDLYSMIQNGLYPKRSNDTQSKIGCSTKGFFGEDSFDDFQAFENILCR